MGKNVEGNIVLSGGSTMFEGFGLRLQMEVSGLTPSTVDDKVIAPLDRKYAVWIGGSCLAQLAFQQMVLLDEEYRDAGPSVVHRMFS